MRRRDFIAAVGAASTLSLAAQAQQRNQLKRIAYIAARGSPNEIFANIRQELARLGWVDGRDLRIETLFAADGLFLRAAAPFVVSTAPDLIVVINTEYVQIFKETTDTIPVLFAFVSDPVASNFVKSFARPGGNLTGFTGYPEPRLAGKWLGLLTELVPRINRVMLLFDPANAVFLPALQEVAPALHVTIHPAPATAIADAKREIETFAGNPDSGMIVIPNALTVGERATITALAAYHRLPTIYGSGDILFIADGGLMSYGPVADDIERGVAQYADRILKGAKPADLPVQAPTKYRLVINAKTAMLLGLTVPPTMLAIADEVID